MSSVTPGGSLLRSPATNTPNKSTNTVQQMIAEQVRQAQSKLDEKAIVQDVLTKEKIEELLHTLEQQSQILTQAQQDNRTDSEQKQVAARHMAEISEKLTNIEKIPADLKAEVESWLQEGEKLNHNLSGHPDELARVFGKFDEFVQKGLTLFGKINEITVNVPLTKEQLSPKEMKKTNFSSTYSDDVALSYGGHSYAQETKENVIPTNPQTSPIVAGADINIFQLLSSVLILLTQMNMNSVQLQKTLNVSLKATMDSIQDAMNVFTQISVAFKQAAANASLLGSQESDLNFGFAGAPNVPSNTPNKTNYNYLISSLTGQSGSANATWNLADYLTMYGVDPIQQSNTNEKSTFYVSTNKQPFNLGKDSSNTNLGTPSTPFSYQTPNWVNKVVRVVGYTAPSNSSLSSVTDVSKDIFLALNSSNLSSFVKQYCYQWGNAAFQKITPPSGVTYYYNYVHAPAATGTTGTLEQKYTNFVATGSDTKTNYLQANSSNQSYFINADSLQTMLESVNKLVKPYTKVNLAESNASWYQNSTQCDQLISSMRSVLTSLQQQDNATVQQLGQFAQNDSTASNTILSLFQAITNALLKL
jgi:hypothetical protein